MDDLEQTYSTWYQPLVALIISKFNLAESEANDVVQEAFLRLTERQGEIRDRGAWLAVVALNECRARHRGRVREEQVAPRPPAAADPGDSTEARICASQALRDLSERERRLLQLHFVEGWTAREIGLATNLSTSYVAKLLHLSIKVARRTCQVEEDVS